MPPPTDYVLLFDPHLGLSPAAFVAAWNHLADNIATARLATVHHNLINHERSPTDIILLTCAQILEPDTLHDLIHTVATHCGATQPLHFLPLIRPDGSPLILVTDAALS